MILADNEGVPALFVVGRALPHIAADAGELRHALQAALRGWVPSQAGQEWLLALGRYRVTARDLAALWANPAAGEYRVGLVNHLIDQGFGFLEVYLLPAEPVDRQAVWAADDLLYLS